MGKNSGLTIEPGMVFTIEPMINAGKKTTKTLSDGWTVVTRDRNLSAQWEHTIAITENGPKILTIRGKSEILSKRKKLKCSANAYLMPLCKTLLTTNTITFKAQPNLFSYSFMTEHVSHTFSVLAGTDISIQLHHRYTREKSTNIR